METEIELKFFVSAEFSSHLLRKIAQAKILQQSSKRLGNIYFDTPEQILRQHDIGLRVRQIDDVFIQTLKTAGRVVAGLHQRPEYNAELNGPQPDLSLHPADAWPAHFDIAAISDQIAPLFSTDFERQQWLIAMPDGSQIELAFDQGEVRAGERSEPICEVELELKSGQTDALFTLARELCDVGGIRLGNLSKAARGYRLAADYPGDAVKPLSYVPLHADASAEQALMTSLEHAMEHWHYHEQIYVERQELAALTQISQAISLIRQTLVVFGSMIPRRASAQLRQELSWLEGELDWLEEAGALDRWLAEKGHALKKLNARKALVKQLKERQEELPEPEDVLRLLHASRYCNLLLNLSSWLLSRGWQPFLDEKARERLAASAKAFADSALAKAWEELGDAFGAPRTLSRADYLDQQARLLRNLVGGLCFASLYDAERREGFRSPWLDVLQGMEDLRQLEPIRTLQPEFEEEEDRKQIDKWLHRKEDSLLHAMDQSRQIGLTQQPYWP
ncbi:inorganic triphosphatase [Photobacterium galatheae]|uniref:Adenylate cyclase n=1 Tax=Photobacterium galatheae TaxID=1654360 RepID=A0A066RYH4_9GAMM|nr:inorganic triphosphatase [Photobacterium galatheae]KDM92448.1 adenylate cyclase [Photobacterium galatheae]MCM0147928.1 inorganic triphosphatase [Photobacterium galatheae]